MLQHTLTRADLLSSRDRQIIVIDRTHIADARPQIDRRPLRNIVRQPCNRDTAAEVFLPMTYIRHRDSEATVVVFPSDHFIYPKEAFAEAVALAIKAAEDLGKLVLLGVRPDHPEPDYGWIVPEKSARSGWRSRVRRVRTFVEKPGVAAAGEAMASGALWNTLVFAVKLEALWQMGRRCFPEMMRLFERFADDIGSPNERAALKQMYSIMPVHNFSSGLLARCVDQVATLELSGVFWSDWGRPERIAETLRHLNKTPAFPWACLEPELRPQSL
jgi:mannose-1-phosphate guanylyltransferase